MSTDPPGLDLEFIEEGRRLRARQVQRRARAAIGVSAGITLAWLIGVSAAGLWDRVADNYASAITMVFGSFVAGSTPQGGGAVAFPVFTKLLEVPTEVARGFSLNVQAVGMGTATAAIVINRRHVEWRAVWLALPISAAAFLLSIWLLGDGDKPFRPSIIPGPCIKVSFTLVVGATALVTYLGYRARIREVRREAPAMNARIYAAFVVVAGLGGVAAALTGSGADVAVYLLLAVLLAVDAKVGVPSSVVVMAGISVLGFIVLGLVDGQLFVSLDGDRVVEIGGTAVDLPADKWDMFGFWLAAAPIVAWGAPLGSWVAARIKSRQLVIFVVILAAAEIISTAVFLDELREDAALLSYALVGAIVLGAGLWWIANNRNRVFGLEGVRTDQSLGRRDLDVAEGYREDLGQPTDSRSGTDAGADPDVEDDASDR